MPRSHDACPFLFALDHDPGALAEEIRSLGYDEILAVDIGGDSLNGKPGRDAEMLAVLQATRLPVRHVVVAPGVDGESTFGELEEPVRGARSHFALAPLLPILREYDRHLDSNRTPNLIVQAHEGRLPPAGDGYVTVPRDKRPRVPLEWLLHGYEFAVPS